MDDRGVACRPPPFVSGRRPAWSARFRRITGPTDWYAEAAVARTAERAADRLDLAHNRGS